MELAGKTALITGANRGLGRQLAQQLRDRGVNVYAGARNPATVQLDGVTAIQLDITDPQSIANAVASTSEISILINNAGSSTGASLLTGDLDDVRREMETHYFGTLLVTRGFAPQLATQNESAVLNILSALSWFSIPTSGAYSAAKSAAWGLTNGLRQELAAQGTRVSSLHVGYMDTDMAKHVEGPKSDPAEVARIAIDGIAAGATEILADDTSRYVLSNLSGGVAALYPEVA